MLPPIPGKILRSVAEVRVCSGTDMYQNQAYDFYTVAHVHLQPTSQIRKTADNTDQQLTSILFVDARHSRPALDWLALLQSAHEHGGDMRVTVRGMEYTVLSVDELRDSGDNLHHWEVGLC